ncbi:hypothetical protein SynSYN20_00912 [Synechococcus sp. SYN20]|nr:hypothetical protein SynSYN20_00912 [Synechococcus sp. SYN20]
MKTSGHPPRLSPGLQRTSAVEPSLPDGVMAFRSSDCNGFAGVL